MDRYIEKILSARVYDVAIESPLEEAPGVDEDLDPRPGETARPAIAAPRRVLDPGSHCRE